METKKVATEYILKRLPYLFSEIELSEEEKILKKLALFFENPNENSIKLNEIYLKLDREFLQIATESMKLFLNHSLYTYGDSNKGNLYLDGKEKVDYK